MHIPRPAAPRLSLVDPADDAVAADLVGWNCRSVYEFGQPTVIGRAAGLTDAEIAALTSVRAAGPWTDSEATFDVLRPRWNDAELVELVALAGFYRMVSGILNSLGVEPEPGLPGWPVS